MGQTSAIEWTDATWNPWQGCTKVSPACAHCYMFRDMARYGRDGSVVVRSKPPTFNLPLKKTKAGNYAISPGSKVFTCSWSDWFHKTADPWRDEAWEIVRRRRDVIFQIVTKRPERILDHLPADWGSGYPNVWLIVTAESQEWLEARMEHFARVPAFVRGLSIEPLLGPIDLRQNLPSERMLRWCRWMIGMVSWVIVGGESGPGARPMHPDWVRSIRDQCQAARVPFFFKQRGEYTWGDLSEDDSPDFANVPDLPGDWRERTDGKFVCMRTDGKYVDGYGGGDEEFLYRVGKKAAGRMLDGRTWSEFPDLTNAS